MTQVMRACDSCGRPGSDARLWPLTYCGHLESGIENVRVCLSLFLRNFFSLIEQVLFLSILN